MKYRYLLAVIWGMIAGMEVYAQPLLNARGTAIGAYDALVNDSRSFVANPAGMVGMRDWDFNTSTYVTAARGGGAFVFYGVSAGKRFLDDNAASIEYTPGALLEFALPSALRISGLADAQKRISYSEPVAIGLAHRFSEMFAAGVSARLRTESVSDPQFQIQFTDSIISATPNQFTRNVWFADLGISVKPVPGLSVCAVGRNLLAIKSGSFPEEFQPYYLPTKSHLGIGAAYELPARITVAAQAATDKTGAVGCEWLPGYNLAVRGGMYLSPDESPAAYAVGFGAGWTFEFLQVDGSMIHFLGNANRSTTIEQRAFDAGSINNITMNTFTRDRISLSVKAMLGNIRESLIHIESADLTGTVFPSDYEQLAYHPLARVRVKNISPRPVRVKASFYVDNLMDAPTETPPIEVRAGEAVDVPLMAVFNEKVRKISQVTICDADVKVSASPTGEYDDKTQLRVLVHGRNDWDGDIYSLRHFVTPDDAAVVRYSRDILLQGMDSLVTAPRELQLFNKAKMLFNAFAGKLLYVNDPKSTNDYVQYPAETLSLRGGDCDDMTVCFASLLSSIGISTSFVEVVPPGHPEQSHVYMLFDSGLSPRYGNSLADNPKRYIVRRKKNGEESIWIPIESTVITKGFNAAWAKGAQEYLDNVEVGLGVVKGWVRIVDVN